MTDMLVQAWLTVAPLAAEAPKTTDGGGGGGSGMMQTVMFIGVMLFILYFLMIRPQRKRQRERTDMLSALSKGDHVVTTGGMRGVITLVRDHEVIVRVADNVTLTFLKSGVARVEPRGIGRANAEDSSDKK